MLYSQILSWPRLLPIHAPPWSFHPSGNGGTMDPVMSPARHALAISTRHAPIIARTVFMTSNVHGEGRAPLLRASLSTVLLALMGQFLGAMFDTRTILRTLNSAS